MKLNDAARELIGEGTDATLVTINPDGSPQVTVVWVALESTPDGDELVSAHLAEYQKTRNIRRDPRVSLFFSDPTGSGLDQAPTVLVQGHAAAPDQVNTSIGAYEREVKLVYRRQPSGAIWSSNPLLRWYFDWYFMRLEITITPTRILWWEQGDLSAMPKVLESPDVD